MDTFATINGRTLKIRLHAHQRPDPEMEWRWRGGPEGQGYLEGPMEDIRYLVEQAPSSLSLFDEQGTVKEVLNDIQWQEPDVMWDRKEDGYEHGLVHVDWK